MKIKARQQIEVKFLADPLKDIDSTIFMAWLMDNVPNMRVSNPSWRVLNSSKEEGKK